MIVLREANQIKITDAAQVATVFRDLLALEDAIARDTEHCFVMHLDVRHTVKLVELVSIGVLDSARVHPRETFRRAIVEGSASIIVAHNHPSGTVTPSDDDIRATETLHQAGQILDIPLIDHIVFTSNTSFDGQTKLPLGLGCEPGASFCVRCWIRLQVSRQWTGSPLTEPA